MALFQKSITKRVNIIIIFLLTGGLGIISFIFAFALTSTLNSSLTDSLEDRSRIIYTAIENFMLPGQASLAVSFFNGLETGGTRETVVLYRSDAVPAFSDSRTINEVNSYINEEFFSSDRPPVLWQGRSLDEELFFQASAMPPKRQIFRNKDSEGVFLFEIYEPLINKPNCASCHGPDHTVRGVIHLTNNITGAIRQQRLFIAAGASLSLVMLIALISILASFLHRAVIGPVKKIGVVCETITDGNLETSVDVEGNNEIARLGITVNRMITGLKERYELSKYVSSSTMQALTGQTSGKRVPLTVMFSDIRGFTAFSEAKDPETVVEALNRILTAQSEIISSLGGDIDKYVGDEIMATFTGKSGPVKSVEAALSIMELLDKSDQFSDLKVGIGINSGVALLGRIGSATRADFTVIGDAVNIASRICAKAAAGTVYITETTARFVHNSFRLSSPQSLTVKGKKEALKVFQVHERTFDKESS